MIARLRRLIARFADWWIGDLNCLFDFDEPVGVPADGLVDPVEGWDQHESSAEKLSRHRCGASEHPCDSADRRGEVESPPSPRHLCQTCAAMAALGYDTSGFHTE